MDGKCFIDKKGFSKNFFKKKKEQMFHEAVQELHAKIVHHRNRRAEYKQNRTEYLEVVLYIYTHTHTYTHIKMHAEYLYMTCIYTHMHMIMYQYTLTNRVDKDVVEKKAGLL